MTVYSINKRVLEQANMTQGSERNSASTIEAAFASVLQDASSRFSSTGQSAATQAMAERLNKPAAEVREPERVEKPDRPEPRKNERHAKRADKPADKPVRTERPEAADAGRQQVEKPEAADETAVAAPVEAGADQADQDVADDQGQAAADGTETQVVAAPVEDGRQKQVMTGELAEAVTEVGEEDANLDPLAGLARDQGKDARQATEDEAELSAAEADAAFDVTGDSLTAAAAQQTKAAEGDAEVEVETDDDLAGRQARDMAEMLDGTGARLQVKVEVADASADQTVIAGEDPLLSDLTLPQQGAAGGQNAGTGNGTAQGKNQGTANAAQQVAQNAALDNALAAGGKAVEAKPFAAALAAQIEAGNQPSSNQGGQSQAAAGLGGIGGPQAAQKAAQAQAAQAPQAPRHVPPQQVMEQVSVQIDKQVKDGADSIKIQLKPVDLGKIEIKLEVGQDGRVTGVVTADNKDTLAILQKDAKGLEKALQDAGLKPESGALSFNLRGEQQRNAEGNGAEGQAGRRRGRVRTGIDATSEASALAAAQNQGRGLGRRSGVDIQV